MPLGRDSACTSSGDACASCSYPVLFCCFAGVRTAVFQDGQRFRCGCRDREGSLQAYPVDGCGNRRRSWKGDGKHVPNLYEGGRAGSVYRGLGFPGGEGKYVKPGGNFAVSVNCINKHIDRVHVCAGHSTYVQCCAVISNAGKIIMA